MLNFEQKKSIFQSFQELQEKNMGNSGINYIYPDSVQRGKNLSKQLLPSGNGYVIGKYMDEETIRTKGYVLDNRGWINIKDFSSGDLHEVIIKAMMSMSGKAVVNHSNALNVKPYSNHLIKKDEESKSIHTIEGWANSYLYHWFRFGIINTPIWCKKNGEEFSSIQTNAFEQSLELVQKITNIWMSAMFGKHDIKK